METTVEVRGVTTIKVGSVNLKLDAKDLIVLRLLEEHKFLTAQQIAKFLHTPNRLFASTIRLTTRYVKQLRDRKFITVNARQVGGVGHGSDPQIWHLDKLGYDVLARLKTIETGRVQKAYKAPTYTFANHRVAINDTKLTFKHIADRFDQMKLGKVLLEEKSWRTYTDLAGKEASLRPDLYVETYRGDLKHHWFVEVDLNTESPVRIVDKCRNYLDYLQSTYATRDKDWCCGEFPAVLWIMPTVKRRDAIRRHIAGSIPELDDTQRPFIVITPKELKGLVVDGKLGELEELTYE